MKRTFLTILLLLILATQIFAIDPTVESVREYRKANEHKFLQEFVRLLEIPNVAADTENIYRNANYLLEIMKQQGLKPRLLGTSGY